MKPLRYAFHRDFPQRFLPLAEAAMRAACAAWQAGGTVSFIEDPHAPAPDIVIEFAPIAKQICAEDGQLKSPWMVALRDLGRIVVNANIPWQSSRWQFWRYLWQPEIFAHELWHILADTSDHFERMGSVSHYTAQWMPDAEDFWMLRYYTDAHARREAITEILPR